MRPPLRQAILPSKADSHPRPKRPSLKFNFSIIELKYNLNYHPCWFRTGRSATPAACRRPRQVYRRVGCRRCPVDSREEIARKVRREVVWRRPPAARDPTPDASGDDGERRHPGGPTGYGTKPGRGRHRKPRRDRRDGPQSPETAGQVRTGRRVAAQAARVGAAGRRPRWGQIYNFPIIFSYVLFLGFRFGHRGSGRGSSGCRTGGESVQREVAGDAVDEVVAGGTDRERGDGARFELRVAGVADDSVGQSLPFGLVGEFEQL